MKKNTLTANTPNGTFSRQTNREYKFIVTSKGFNLSTLEASHRREVEWKTKEYTKYADIAAGTRPLECGLSREWYAETAAKLPEVLARLEEYRQALLAVYAKELATGQGQAHGWSSRRDLAAKLASEVMGRGYLNVEISEVGQ